MLRSLLQPPIVYLLLSHFLQYRNMVPSIGSCKIPPRIPPSTLSMIDKQLLPFAFRPCVTFRKGARHVQSSGPCSSSVSINPYKRLPPCKPINTIGAQQHLYYLERQRSIERGKEKKRKRKEFLNTPSKPSYFIYNPASFLQFFKLVIPAP